MSDKKPQATRYVIGTEDGDNLPRFSYLNVHTRRKNKESGKDEHSVTILIPKTAVSTVASLKRIIAEQTELFFPKGAGKGPMFWYPLRDGDTDVTPKGKPYGPEAKGHYVLAAKNEEEVGVVGTEIGADKKAKSLFYVDDGQGGQRRRTLIEFNAVCKSGDFGRVSVNIKGYTKGTGGVAAYLNGLQKVRDGEALAGGIDAGDEFAAYGGGSESVLD